MICLRCGYCCKHYAVIIVDDPEQGIIEGNLILHSGKGVACKYLTGDEPGEYECAVHNESRYPETPCFSHTQIERGNTNCRMGEYILEKYQKNDSNILPTVDLILER